MNTETQIVEWFSERLESESVESEPYNEYKITVILQEELSLKLIKKIFEFEKETVMKITDIRVNWCGLCVDIESPACLILIKDEEDATEATQ